MSNRLKCDFNLHNATEINRHKLPFNEVQWPVLTVFLSIYKCVADQTFLFVSYQFLQILHWTKVEKSHYSSIFGMERKKHLIDLCYVLFHCYAVNKNINNVFFGMF